MVRLRDGKGPHFYSTYTLSAKIIRTHVFFSRFSPLEPIIRVGGCSLSLSPISLSFPLAQRKSSFGVHFVVGEIGWRPPISSNGSTEGASRAIKRVIGDYYSLQLWLFCCEGRDSPAYDSSVFKTHIIYALMQ